MKIKIMFFLILSFFVLNTGLLAQAGIKKIPDLKIMAKVDKTILLPGDLFTFEIEFFNASPSLSLTSTDFDKLQIILVDGPIIKKNKFHVSYKYKLSAELPGEFFLPVIFLGGNDKKKVPIHCGGVSIKVKNLLGKDKKKIAPADIIDIKAEPFLTQNQKIILLILSGILIAVLLLIIIVKKIRAHRERPEELVPPEIEARNRLKQLEKLVEDDEKIHETYFEISYCLRKFLGRSLNLFILESTTNDVLQLLQKVSYNPRKSDEVVNELRSLDNVKFALALTDIKERQIIFKQAYKIIDDNSLNSEEKQVGSKK